ncbi:MAG TPA: hypothetical protein VG605_03750 [Puia sp.]|nr:hypothetical protein [Puia sp.]
MDLENPTSQDLKAAILADAQIFLASLRSGASEDQLNAILDRIKEREIRLIAEKGLRLSPEVWNILHKRLVHRRPNEIIDTDLGWLSR